MVFKILELRLRESARWLALTDRPALKHATGQAGADEKMPGAVEGDVALAEQQMKAWCEKKAVGAVNPLREPGGSAPARFRACHRAADVRHHAGIVQRGLPVP